MDMPPALLSPLLPSSTPPGTVPASTRAAPTDAFAALLDGPTSLAVHRPALAVSGAILPVLGRDASPVAGLGAPPSPIPNDSSAIAADTGPLDAVDNAPTPLGDQPIAVPLATGADQIDVSAAPGKAATAERNAGRSTPDPMAGRAALGDPRAKALFVAAKSINTGQASKTNPAVARLKWPTRYDVGATGESTASSPITAAQAIVGSPVSVVALPPWLGPTTDGPASCFGAGVGSVSPPAVARVQEPFATLPAVATAPVAGDIAAVAPPPAQGALPPSTGQSRAALVAPVASFPPLRQGASTVLAVQVPAPTSSSQAPSTVAAPAPESASPVAPALLQVAVSNIAATATPPIVTVAPASHGLPELAGRVFAAAMHLAGTRDERRLPRADAPVPTNASAPGTSLDLTRVQPSAAPAIDLTDRHWPARMMEHIEALRDGADAGNTRVRFAPDALGPVELRVRHDGDQVHLHFTADDAGTRALLGDARPELARLASERGVRLGDTSVGPGDDQSRRQPAAPARFTAPPRTASTDATTDTRIA